MVAAALLLHPYIIPIPQDFRRLMPDQPLAAMANYFMRCPAYTFALKINSQSNEKRKNAHHYYGNHASPIRERKNDICFVL
jgi:hypothetical protein